MIFHLAAQADVRISVDRPVFDAEVNILGTIQALEGARAAGGAKIVFAASGGTLYGEPDGDHLPVDEHEPHRPLSPYGVSKKSAIDYMVEYRELHGIEFTALALANVYGPRQNPHGEAGVVAIFAGNLTAGHRCVIYGDGKQTRDYVYVDDVVDAFARGARHGDGLVLNIGTGQETSVNRLYEIVAACLGSDLHQISPGTPRRGAKERPRRAGQACTSGGSPGQALKQGSSPSSPTSAGLVRDSGPLWRCRCRQALVGMQQVVDPAEIVGVVNTGDDTELHGLHISPDLDTITYTLSGAVNPTTGWGLDGDTFRAMAALERFGASTWFRLGDADLRDPPLPDGSHSRRGFALRCHCGDLGCLRPRRRSAAHERRPGSHADCVSPTVKSAFRRTSSKLRHSVVVSEVRFEGAELARPGPGVIGTLERPRSLSLRPRIRSCPSVRSLPCQACQICWRRGATRSWRSRPS